MLWSRCNLLLKNSIKVKGLEIHCALIENPRSQVIPYKIIPISGIYFKQLYNVIIINLNI